MPYFCEQYIQNYSKLVLFVYSLTMADPVLIIFVINNNNGLVQASYKIGLQSDRQECNNI